MKNKSDFQLIFSRGSFSTCKILLFFFKTKGVTVYALLLLLNFFNLINENQVSFISDGLTVLEYSRNIMVCVIFV